MEREGGQIDRALLKNALDIYIELGIDHYLNDFEVPMMRDTSAYYSRKASSWILEDSCPEYLLKASSINFFLFLFLYILQYNIIKIVTYCYSFGDAVRGIFEERKG